MNLTDPIVCRVKMKKTIFIFGEGELPKLILNNRFPEKDNFFIILFRKPKFSFGFNYKVVNIGKVVTELKYLKKNGFDNILMAGSINRPRINQIKPDLNSLRLLPSFSKVLFQGGDDKLLRFIINEIEKLGLNVLSLTKFCPELFLGNGLQTKKKIHKSFFYDISKGKLILKSISKFDIGQSIVLQNGSVIGIEAAQGTDKLIKQSFPYLKDVRKGILIKIIKNNQDLRADLPTIGLNTVKNCKKYGIEGVAFSANKTVIVNKEVVLDYCNKNQIFLYGI